MTKFKIFKDFEFHIINLSLYIIIVINVAMDSINSLESMERII